MSVQLRRFVIPLVLAVGAALLPSGANAGAALYSISGLVTDAADGSGVSGICVYADPVGGTQAVAQAHSLVGGGYRLLVPAGDYLVHFIDCRSDSVYAAQWYDDAYDRQHATPVAIHALSLEPAAAGINAVLRQGAPVSGTVTDHATGVPISGICVSAIDTLNESRGGAPSTSTDSTGRWQLVLPNGDYVISFRDCRSNPSYAYQYWNDKTSYLAADIVTVNAPLTRRIGGIDAALDHGGTITGRVTDDTTGQPLAGMCVGSTAEVPLGRTDATGTYTITNVPPGTFQVELQECQYTVGGPRYAPEWYHHEPTRAVATPVSVAPATTTVVDETMRVGGDITGTVTDASTGQPVEGAIVQVLAADTDSRAFTRTAADGTYTITGLYEGDHYKVDFTYPAGDPSGLDYQEQWWNDAATQGTATDISVRFDQTTSGIDAALQPK